MVIGIDGKNIILQDFINHYLIIFLIIKTI